MIDPHRISVIDEIESFLSSPEGQRALAQKKEEFRKAKRAQRNWNYRFKRKWFETGKFGDWMKKMSEENGEEHIKSEYKRGCQPSPTFKLSRTFEFARMNASKIGKVLDSEQIYAKFRNNEGPVWNSVGWEIKGYSFVETQGQGVFFEVYNPDNKRIIALG